MRVRVYGEGLKVSGKDLGPRAVGFSVQSLRVRVHVPLRGVLAQEGGPKHSLVEVVQACKDFVTTPRRPGIPFLGW